MRRLAILAILAFGCADATQGQTNDGRAANVATAVLTVTIASDADLTDEADIADYSILVVDVPSTFDGTDLKWHCSPTTGGTFTEIKTTADASCTTVTSASQHAGVPSGDCALAVGACRWIKIETSSDQTSTNTIFNLSLKR